MTSTNLNIDSKHYNNLSDKKTVAFIPIIFNLGETIPLLEIGKRFEKLGGKPIFICYKGGFENIIKDYGFRYITFDIDVLAAFREHIKKVKNYDIEKIRFEDVIFKHFEKCGNEINHKVIEQEIKILKREKIELIVTGFHTISRISAKKANIPIMFIISSVASSLYFKSNYATYPENYENFLTKLIPRSIKNRLTNMYVLKSKMNIKPFNKFAKKYDIPKLKYFYELFNGDYTLLADDINFLNLKPSKEFPSENFIGPIIADKLKVPDSKKINDKINEHLRRPGKSILVTMGTSTSNKLIINIINVLNNLKYNTIIVFSKLEKELIPKLNENVIYFDKVSSILEVNKKVDLAIIHGGRGTVYTAAYSGKPAIGYPMQVEQQYNLDNLVRNKTAIRLSKKYFTEEKLINAINNIFENYEKYLLNAQRLKDKLQKPNGAENAAKIIYKIVNKKIIKKKKI